MSRRNRTLALPDSPWGQAQNDKLMRKIDKDGDGEIELQEFTSYFTEASPADPKPVHRPSLYQFLRLAILSAVVGQALTKDRAAFDVVMDQFGEAQPTRPTREWNPDMHRGRVQVADECAIKKHPKSSRHASVELVDFTLEQILAIMDQDPDALTLTPPQP